jgi:hypothetical protein
MKRARSGGGDVYKGSKTGEGAVIIYEKYF